MRTKEMGGWRERKWLWGKVKEGTERADEQSEGSAVGKSVSAGEIILNV